MEVLKRNLQNSLNWDSKIHVKVLKFRRARTKDTRFYLKFHSVVIYHFLMPFFRSPDILDIPEDIGMWICVWVGVVCLFRLYNIEFLIKLWNGKVPCGWTIKVFFGMIVMVESLFRLSGSFTHVYHFIRIWRYEKHVLYKVPFARKIDDTISMWIQTLKATCEKSQNISQVSVIWFQVDLHEYNPCRRRTRVRNFQSDSRAFLPRQLLPVRLWAPQIGFT